MNKTKEKDHEAYEPPVVTDIAPVTVARGGDGSNAGDNENIGDEY